MSAVIATVAAPKLSPVEQFKMLVLPPEKAAELARALPAHIRPERFERNLLNALMQNPALLKCHPGLVYREVSKAAGLGLVLDPEIGEAYILTVWNPKTKAADMPQLRLGYRGLLRLARQSGEVASCYAHAVHEQDFIECELGDNPKLVHKPKLFGERGPAIGYYAVVRYKDGTTDFEPMNREDVEKIRAQSDAYKAFAAGRIKSTPWETSFDEMARKTAIRRLLKRVPKSPDLADAMVIEDQGDRARNITPVAGVGEQIAAPSKLDQLEDASGIGATVDAPEDDDPGITGEVMDDDPRAPVTDAQPDPLAPIRAALDTCKRSSDIDGMKVDFAELLDSLPAQTRGEANALILAKQQQLSKTR